MVVRGIYFLLKKGGYISNITATKYYTNTVNIFIILLGFFLSISISISQISLALLLILFIVYLINNKYNIFTNDIYFLLFCFYWLSSILSTIFGSEYALLGKGLTSPWPMLIFFVSYYFVNTKNLNSIILAFAIGLFVMAVSGFYYYFGFSGGIYPRSHSIVAPYMMTAHLLTIGIVFLTAVILSKIEKNKIIIMFYILTIIIAYYSLFLTSTRTPLLAVLLVSCLMFIFKLKWKGVVLAIVLCCIFISYIMLNSYMVDRFYNLLVGFDNPSTSHGWRFYLWKNSFIVLKDYFLFGVGEGAFSQIITPMMPNNVNLPTGHAHNSYVMHLVSYGIVGIITFILFYGKIAIDLVKKLYSSQYAFIGFSVFIAYVLEGITEDNFGLSLSSMQALFLVGLMCGMLKKEA